MNYMKLRRRLTGAVCAAALAVSAFGGNVPVSAAQKIVIMPNDESPFGEFQGWGTSLCWWANRVGYSEKMTKQAADLFFSEDGLGLNIARYNLGGGDDPEHNHITRSDSKVPGVWKTFELSEDGKDVNITEYDLSKDQNQLNIAKAALEANPDLYFEGFSNSAPYFMTNSGCTGGGDPASSDNLKSDMYDDFGK
ncbi:MAG: alpha-L-arabinofuranosidase, partial [Oscillospiraceae bacterium]|nr:alpha-L-arabinofuranosidase [Oscillospiraceae bacterium]